MKKFNFVSWLRSHPTFLSSYISLNTWFAAKCARVLCFALLSLIKVRGLEYKLNEQLKSPKYFGDDLDLEEYGTQYDVVLFEKQRQTAKFKGPFRRSDRIGFEEINKDKKGK